MFLNNSSLANIDTSIKAFETTLKRVEAASRKAAYHG